MTMIGCCEVSLLSIGSWDWTVSLGFVGLAMWRSPIGSSSMMSLGFSDSADSDSSVDSSVSSLSSCSSSSSSFSPEESVLSSSSDALPCPSRGSSCSSSS